MSKLNAIMERVASSKDSPGTENFALQVTGYEKDVNDRDSIMGIRLDTGEDVSVVLRPYKGTTPLKAARAEVKDFQAKEGEISALMKALPDDQMRKQVLKGMKAKTEPGGTIIVQRSYVERDTGVVNAGWLASAAKYPGHAKVLPNALVRVDPVRYVQRDGRDVAIASATVLDAEQATKVKSLEELEQVLQRAFEGGMAAQGRPLALVRLSDGSQTKAIEFGLPVAQNEDKFSYVTPAEGVEAALKMKVGQQIKELVGDPDITVEVVPGSRISVGPQARASYETSKGGLAHINRSYRHNREDSAETGFTRSYIVLHEVENGDVFSLAEPLSNKPILQHPRDIATANISSAPTASNNHSSAPADPGYDMDDEPFDVDDVVNNAGPEDESRPTASTPRPRM